MATPKQNPRSGKERRKQESPATFKQAKWTVSQALMSRRLSRKVLLRSPRETEYAISLPRLLPSASEDFVVALFHSFETVDESGNKSADKQWTFVTLALCFSQLLLVPKSASSVLLSMAKYAS